MDTKYDFPVGLMQVSAAGNEIPHKLAVIRKDTGDFLGIVSDKYDLLQHSEVIDGFRSALDGVEYVQRVQMAKRGAVMYAHFRMPAHTVEVRKGDAVALEFIVKNSYDGSNALQIMLGAFRLVCTNGMVIGKRFFTYSQRHIGTKEGINVEFLHQKVNVLTEQFKGVLPHLQEMSRTEVSTDGETLFKSPFVVLPNYLLTEAQEEYNRAGDTTRWGYYNSLTSAITHNMKRESPTSSIQYGKVAWAVAMKA